MKNWDDLKFCLALARHKKMSAAAIALDTNVATVSRRIARLTEDIGETLFVKIEGLWSPTEAAEPLVTFAAALDADLRVNDQRTKVRSGTTLRLSCALPLLQAHFLEGSARFLEAHPDVNLDITLQPKSLALGEVDVAITCHEPKEGKLIRQLLARSPCHAYAHSKFADAIEGWVQIGYDGHGGREKEYFAAQYGEKARMILEGLNLTCQVIQLMPLVAILPDKFAANHPELVRIDTADDVDILDVWISYHASRRLDPLVSMAKKLVTDCFQTDRLTDSIANVQN